MQNYQLFAKNQNVREASKNSLLFLLYFANMGNNKKTKQKTKINK